ncbi:hypothetical protein NX059_010943 [Plenodomus lindquistii]|nr:hypothetical protein NX059_010943 [Plenodomus lindquistii]
MGRTETSKGLAPPAVRKDVRAKQARQIINKAIPAILASNPRARKGSESSELIANPGPVTRSSEIKSNEDAKDDADAMYTKRKGQGRRKNKNEEVEDGGPRNKADKRRSKTETMSKDMERTIHLTPQPPPKQRTIRILATDTLTAAHTLTFPPSTHPNKPRKSQPNTCILNMASPLRPGGGVLAGATSQEEFLCARTTLLPSLSESYYRLPEYGGIFTPDVLVFRNALPLSDAKGELGGAERWWVDVVSAGMLRFPELEGGEDEAKWLGKKDRAVVEGKMRAVLRICVMKGAKRVVLGAWGCGAYGCPVKDVAEAWRKVLDGSSVGGGGKGKGRGHAEGESFAEIEEVVFAIGNRNLAKLFAQAFGDIEVEDVEGAEDDGEEEADEVAKELRSKIREMEEHLGKVWNPDLKERMGIILEGLKGQLGEREGVQKTGSDGDFDDGDDDDDDDSSIEA